MEPTTQQGVNYGCESGWSSFEGSCYLLANSINDHMAFDQAQAACKQERADLVEIFSERENEFLVSMLRTRANSKSLNCPSGWMISNNQCYQLVINHASSNWTAAQRYCSNIGGYLAAIKSQDDQNFVANLIKSIYY